MVMGLSKNLLISKFRVLEQHHYCCKRSRFLLGVEKYLHHGGPYMADIVMGSVIVYPNKKVSLKSVYLRPQFFVFSGVRLSPLLVAIKS